MSAAAPGEFHYANELVSFIRETHGEPSRSKWPPTRRCIRRRPSPSVDFDNFRRKVEAGADGAMTQLFYNADAYFDFMERCARAGITIPVVPGIMPITGLPTPSASAIRLRRRPAALGAAALEELQDDKPALLDFGLEVVTRLCETLLENGAPGLHFYTINQAGPTLRLWKTWRALEPLWTKIGHRTPSTATGFGRFSKYAQILRGVCKAASFSAQEMPL